jgi:general secretion pathway protein D
VVRREQINAEDVQEIDTGTSTNVEVRPVNAMMAAPTPPASMAQAQASVPAFGAQAAPADAPPPPIPTQTGSAPEAAAHALTQMQQAANAGPPVSLQITPAQSNQKAGSTFQMAVNTGGSSDEFAAQMQVQYDTSKLSLINVDTENKTTTNVLGRDGQAVALAHRDDGNGNVAIAVSRPPNTKGVNGAGLLCVLTFQAKAPGDASVAVSRPVVHNSQQQISPAMGSQAVVHIQ